MDRSTASYAEPRPRDFAARARRKSPTIADRQRRRHRGRRLAALALAIGVPAFAAPADWNELPSFGTMEEPAVEPLGFEIPGESFPGSAFYYLEDTPYLPGVSLPEGDATDEETDLSAGPVAQPFKLGGSQVDRARALQCLTLAIYYEAASESDAGQRAVAQVVLNRVAHPTYPNSVCGVVFQGSERTTGCQFSFTCDGSLARQPSRVFWDRARKVAAAALAGAVYKPIGLATHYHTIWIHPYWADSLNNLATIGAHTFYRWKGAAGLPGAFSSAYAGNEPLPAPRPRSRTAPEPVTDPVELARIYEASHPQPAAHRTANDGWSPAPAYAAGIEAQGGDAQFDGRNLPASGSVRDEYARSGEWIVRP